MDFKNLLGLSLFLIYNFFYRDGRMVVDGGGGGWWWMVAMVVDGDGGGGGSHMRPKVAHAPCRRLTCYY